MPAWILFSLLAAVSIAVVSVIDKTVLANWMTDANGSFFVFGVIETISGILALALLGFPHLAPGLLAVTIASGAAISLSTLCYFQSIRVADLASVIPLYDLSPLLVALFAALFLHEVVTPANYLGIVLIVGGALFLSLKSVRTFRFGKGTAWMLLSVLLISGAAVTSKYLLDNVDPWTLFAYAKLGTSLVVLPFAVPGYRAFMTAFRKFGWRVPAMTGLSEGITSLTTIFFLFAGSTGYITLVNALVGIQPLFLLAFTVLLTRYWPRVLNEKIERGVLPRRILSIASLLVGAWLIT